MFDAFNKTYAWMSEVLGGNANTNLVLMGFVAIGLGWLVLRAVRTGAAIGAAARATAGDGSDPTLLLALRQAEARIKQLEDEIDHLSRQRNYGRAG
jgi:hypothetical protein